MNIVVMQHDYQLLSLSRLSQPVEVIEVPVLDIRIYEGIEARVVEEEESVGVLAEEETAVAVLMDEEEPVAEVVEEEEITGTLTDEEDIIGVLECDP